MSRTRILLIEIAGFLAFTLALFLFAAALSGGGSSQVPPRDDNLCGPVGERVAQFLWQWVGRLGTWGAVALLAGSAFALMGKRNPRYFPVRALGAALFCICLSALENLVSRHGGAYEGPIVAGGYFGFTLADLATLHLSFLGACLVAGFGLVVALVLATDIIIAPDESYFLRTTRGGFGAAGRTLRLARPALSFMGKINLRSLFSRSDTRAAARPAVRGGTALAAAPATRRGRPKRAEKDELDETDHEEIDEVDEEVEGTEDDDGASDEPTDEDDETADEAPARPIAPREIAIRVGPTRNDRSRSRKGAGIQRRGNYTLPSLELLKQPDAPPFELSREEVKGVAHKIEETLQSFRIEGRVVEIQRGPVITQYEVLLAPGIKVHRLTNLASELAMALKARSIRLVAPIPGKSTVGIEVPNPQREIVHLRDLLESETYLASSHEIPLILGKDGVGNAIVSDLTLMPHLLIAGSTGSGKSVCLNSVIITTLMTRSPEEVKLILVDPKMVELSEFADVPHLLCPVVTDMKKAPPALAWLVGKMEERYEILSQAAVRNIVAFNRLGKEKVLSRIEGKLLPIEIEKFPTFLPYIVLVVDELADLMLTGGKEVEAHIIRLAQKSRAVGIHVILATQRPSVDVITGLIKANMPCRISFQVSSKVDSRTILDRNGAESLLGRGDMLFLPPGAADLRRVQCCFVSDQEIKDVVGHVRTQADAEFDEELQGSARVSDDPPSERDDLYDEAVRIVLETQRGSATLLQRRLEVGYTRASRLMDMMAEEGIVGEFKGSKAREVYYTLEEWETAKARAAGGA